MVNQLKNICKSLRFGDTKLFSFVLGYHITLNLFRNVLVASSGNLTLKIIMNIYIHHVRAKYHVFHSKPINT